MDPLSCLLCMFSKIDRTLIIMFTMYDITRTLCKFSKYVVLLFYIWLRMYRRYMDKFAICEWNLGELADLYLNLSGPILQCMAWSWPAPLSGIRFIDKTGWGLVYLTHHSRRHTPCFVLFGASSFLDRSTSLWFSTSTRFFQNLRPANVSARLQPWTCS